MNDREKVTVRHEITKDNRNLYTLSNGIKILTLMRFPKSLLFYRNLERFAEEHSLSFDEKYLNLPYTYGQVNHNGKIVFLDYLGEEGNNFKYVLSNIITPDMLSQTTEIYCEHNWNEVEKRLEEIVHLCERAIDQGKTYEEFFYDKKKYYEFLYEEPVMDIEFFGDFEDMNS